MKIRNKTSNEVRKSIINLFKQNMSERKISDKVNYSKSVVGRVIKPIRILGMFSVQKKLADHEKLPPKKTESSNVQV